MSKEGQSFKSRVREHLAPIATPSELKDHDEHTTNELSTQKEYLRRFISERSDNPLAEVDTLQVVGNLDEDSICPFINGHLAEVSSG